MKASTVYNFCAAVLALNLSRILASSSLKGSIVNRCENSKNYTIICTNYKKPSPLIGSAYFLFSMSKFESLKLKRDKEVISKTIGIIISRRTMDKLTKMDSPSSYLNGMALRFKEKTGKFLQYIMVPKSVHTPAEIIETLNNLKIVVISSGSRIIKAKKLVQFKIILKRKGDDNFIPLHSCIPPFEGQIDVDYATEQDTQKYDYSDDESDSSSSDEEDSILLQEDHSPNPNHQESKKSSIYHQEESLGDEVVNDGEYCSNVVAVEDSLAPSGCQIS